MNLGGFIDTFKDAIARRVVESYPPLYRPSENGGTLPRLLRKPLGAQADAIRGAALSLKAHRGTTVVGEMGTGKTFIGAAAAYMAGFERILIICNRSGKPGSMNDDRLVIVNSSHARGANMSITNRAYVRAAERNGSEAGWYTPQRCLRLAGPHMRDAAGSFTAGG